MELHDFEQLELQGHSLSGHSDMHVKKVICQGLRENPITGTFANSEDPGEIKHNAEIS